MSIPPYQVENAADINIIMDNSVETVQNSVSILQPEIYYYEIVNFLWTLSYCFHKSHLWDISCVSIESSKEKPQKTVICTLFTVC